MELLQNINTILDPRDYLLFFSILVLLAVTYALYRGYRATRAFEQKIEHFSSLTNDTFARHLNQLESVPARYDVKSGKFGPLSRILDAYAVSTTDARGVLTYVNTKFCQSCGYTKEELIGQPHKIIGASRHAPEFWKEMWETINSGKVWHGEIANHTHDGKLFWTDTFIFPLSLISETGDDGFITLRTDITAMKQQNTTLSEAVEKTGEKLQQVESMLLMSEKMSSLGAISAGIAHEINNPVAFVNSNMAKMEEYFTNVTIAMNLLLGESLRNPELAKRMTQSGDIDREELTYILEDGPNLIRETQDGIQRIANIAADLKSFSHQGTDEQFLTDLRKCINTALNLARNELKYKVEIVRDFSETLPQIPCVESKITQVLLNLFVNASHAIQDNGQLTISTSCDADFAIITVRDNGCGMTDEVQAKIFEPFYTTKPVGKGTGLGLSLSHDIIRRHNGKLTVSSQKGVGTEFRIMLPLGKPRLVPDEGIETVIPKRASRHG
jgi:two-component system NtrC family sensor kinase